MAWRGILAGLAVCALPAQEGAAPRLPEEEARPAGWSQAAGPGGLELSLPPGFVLQCPPGGGARVIGDGGKAGPTTSYVLVEPFLARAGEEAAAYLRRVPAARFAALPEFALEKLAAPGPGQATARIRYTLNGIPRLALLHCAAHGRAGMSYCLAAPAGGFTVERIQLARIAMSLRYRPGAGGEPAPPLAGMSFQTWRDPGEGAFTLEVPEGWQVQGGLVRRGSLDWTAAATLVSPDGQARAFVGDPRCRISALPGPALEAMGFHEGRWVSPGPGQNVQVRSFQPGPGFLAGLLAADRLQILLQRPDPELSARLAALGGLAGEEAARTVAAGELLFRRGDPKEPFGGNAWAATERWVLPGGKGGWAPLALIGWEARPGAEALAEAVLLHACRTFRLDRSWSSSQAALGAAGAEAREAVLGELAAALAALGPQRRARLAQELPAALPPGGLKDPETGELFLPAWGRNYLWRGYPPPPGQAGPPPPDFDLHPLLEL